VGGVDVHRLLAGEEVVRHETGAVPGRAVGIEHPVDVEEQQRSPGRLLVAAVDLFTVHKDIQRLRRPSGVCRLSRFVRRPGRRR
jgi:hypothetical protein